MLQDALASAQHANRAKTTFLNNMSHDLRTIIHADINSKQLELFIDTVDVINEDVTCDKLCLNQILLNLLSSAMKSTKPGGMVSLCIIQAKEFAKGHAGYEFRVKDTGIGMSKEFQESIFEAFTRERTSAVSGIQGTGLGMAITKSIVDIMGGVDVEVPMDMDVDEIVLSKGYQHLSGDQVLALLRFRKGYATADLGRIQVQRAVMKAAMEQWLSPAHLVGAVKAVSLLENSSLSSLSTGNYLWVAKTLLLGMSDFRSDTLPGYADYRNKVSYYILEPEKVLELLNESYNPFRTSIPAGNLNIAG